MKRGEVWWVNFEPSIGGEIRKQRPVVIISNDLSNKYLNRLQVVPLTSSKERVYPSEAIVTVNNKQSKAMADQLTTISKQRLIKQYGFLDYHDMKRVENAVNLQLGLVMIKPPKSDE